jgi:crossover junction endodeoxyribonuclease RuvC
MRVLGIDPGSLHTGYGVIEENGNDLKLIAAGCITNKTKDRFDLRYNHIFSELQIVINDTHPTIAALENVIYCNNTQVAIKLGEARGVAILAAAKAGVPIREYSPKKIKQAVVGNGNASKEQVQGMIQKILRLNEVPFPDTADALAAAICHLNNAKLEKLYNKQL